ncbi:Uncharacterized protein DAT39_001983, partial [Clarias magur]
MCHRISEKQKEQKLDNRLSSEPLDEEVELLNSGKTLIDGLARSDGKKNPCAQTMELENWS